jgi:hypothetical protein
MLKKLHDKIQYYFFLQKIQFLVVARFLLMVVPVNFFLKSDTYSYYSGFILDRYLLWKYGSITNLGLITDLEKLYLINKIVNISGFLSFFLVLILYVYSVVYVFHNISFKKYAVHRHANILDDIGFAVSYSILLFMYSYPMLLLLDFALYKMISVYFIQILVFYFLFKTKAWGYYIKKRSKPLKT